MTNRAGEFAGKAAKKVGMTVGEVVVSAAIGSVASSVLFGDENAPPATNSDDDSILDAVAIEGDTADNDGDDAEEWIEVVAIDANGDGLIDAIAVDDDGDGLADAVAFDVDYDGVADVVAVEEDCFDECETEELPG
jgi:hypothetical protein